MPTTTRSAIREQIRADLSDQGGVWVLTGPPGIGKTHLVRQLAGELTDGARLARACGREGERRFGPLLAAARELHGPGPVHEGGEGGESASGVPEEIRLAERLVGRLRQAGERSPRILCCDDLESFDAASLACVLSMLWRMDRLPFSLLLVREEGAVQPPEVARLWRGVDETAGKPVRWFRLPPLTAEEAEGFCRARLGGALRLGRANLHWLLRVSGGNPLYLGEILDHLRDTAWLSRTAGGWRLVAGAPASPPELEELIRRRVDAATAREPAGARALLEYGAARGLRFETALVAAAAGWEAERAGPVLQRLGERTGYLLPRTALAGGGEAFELDHELTRQGLLAGLGGRRRGVYLRLAHAHEAQGTPSYPLLAALYEGAEEWRHAAEECGLAAVEALARGFPGEAARLARWQDALLERAGERREEAGRLAVAETRAEALVAAGRAAEAAHLLQPLTAAAVRLRRPRLLFLLGTASARLPAEEPAREQAPGWLRRAREMEDLAAQPVLAARLLLETALACQAGGDEAGARKAHGRAMDAARRAGDLALQLHLLRLCRRFFEADTALRHLENAVALARQQQRDLDEALCLNNLAVVSMELGRLAEARDHWTSSLEILTASGPWGTALPLANLAFLAFARGDVEEAGALLEQARTVAWEPAVALPLRCQQAAVRAVQGELEEAVRELRALAAEAERLGERESVPRVRFNLARALLEAGRPDEALRSAMYPPPWQGSDRDLAEASLARLRLEAFGRLHLRPEAGLQRQARVLERNGKVQAWLYRLPWARGDVQFR